MSLRKKRPPASPACLASAYRHERDQPRHQRSAFEEGSKYHDDHKYKHSSAAASSSGRRGEHHHDDKQRDHEQGDSHRNSGHEHKRPAYEEEDHKYNHGHKYVEKHRGRRNSRSRSPPRRHGRIQKVAKILSQAVAALAAVDDQE